jgi:hypothetical protein
VIAAPEAAPAVASSRYVYVIKYGESSVHRTSVKADSMAFFQYLLDTGRPIIAFYVEQAAR